MSAAVIIALLSALIVYMTVGIVVGRRAKGIADLLPMADSRRAQVKNPAEFSSSTVATTISLATVILLFFKLAGDLGLWLFWTAITTSVGVLVVRLFAGRIWERMSSYDHRPTLHEFLGKEYNSPVLCRVGAVCTSLGFLGAFAVELTVGSQFLAGLVPGIPAWIVILVLSLAAFFYTAVGGFRAVIITDRIQMVSIWVLLISLPFFYVYYVVGHGGWSASLDKVPAEVLSMSYRPGLTSFLLGIFVINVPTFISDMSIWQRIAGARQKQTVTAGLWRGVFSVAATWGVFVLLACFVFMIVAPGGETNPLILLLNVIGRTGGLLGVCVLFITVLGLYGAMLSTASTQLIAVSHTLYQDVVSRFRARPLAERLESRKELNVSRCIVVFAALVSTVAVQLLYRAGFSIVDLVFAIYGAQLGLCPLVVMALLTGRRRLRNLSAPATWAVSAGFVVGWGAAIYGRSTDNANLVFLAPVFSLIASSLLLSAGILREKLRRLWFENVNLILIRSIVKARKAGLYRLAPADKPARLDCLKDKCARCCRTLGTPVTSAQEADRIGYESIMTDRDARFVRSQRCTCTLLRDGLCSIYPKRPRGCCEYPWYNIAGKLYYDRGCPGVKYDKDERPDAGDIQPFENFFPHSPGFVVWIVKKLCLQKQSQ